MASGPADRAPLHSVAPLCGAPCVPLAYPLRDAAPLLWRPCVASSCGVLLWRPLVAPLPVVHEELRRAVRIDVRYAELGEVGAPRRLLLGERRRAVGPIEGKAAEGAHG